MTSLTTEDGRVLSQKNLFFIWPGLHKVLRRIGISALADHQYGRESLFLRPIPVLYIVFLSPVSCLTNGFLLFRPYNMVFFVLDPVTRERRGLTFIYNGAIIVIERGFQNVHPYLGRLSRSELGQLTRVGWPFLLQFFYFVINIE